MTESDWPDDVIDAAAEALHVPEMLETIARQEAFIDRMIDGALQVSTSHPAAIAIKAAELLHHADREHAESGQMPEETHREAVELAHQHHRQTWQRKIAAESNADRGRV